MDKKTEIQDKFIEQSVGEHSVLLNAYTGFGKSRYSTELMNRGVGNKAFLVLVPKIVLINNFREDYLKWGGDLSRIEDIICYDSLYKYEGRELNIVADEAHHCTESVLSSLDRIESDKRIFLSATITNEIIERINSHFPLRVFKYTLPEAINDGIAPPQDIRVVRVELDDRNRKYEHKGKKITAKQKYQYLSNDVDYWKNRYLDEGIHWQNFKWMQAALQRKNWMAEYKLPVCKQLLSHLDEERYICFTNSVAQAKELGGKNAVHSKQNSKINLQLIDKFNRGETNRLFTKDILSEGINLVNCYIGVFHQLDVSESKTSQKLGRINRVELPITYIILLSGTRDQEYFNNNFKQYKQYIKEWKQDM
jgi:superfamily II DNA or RNA helicase